MASHIECRFNKNSLPQCYFLAILPAGKILSIISNEMNNFVSSKMVSSSERFHCIFIFTYQVLFLYYHSLLPLHQQISFHKSIYILQIQQFVLFGVQRQLYSHHHSRHHLLLHYHLRHRLSCQPENALFLVIHFHVLHHCFQRLKIDFGEKKLHFIVSNSKRRIRALKYLIPRFIFREKRN